MSLFHASVIPGAQIELWDVFVMVTVASSTSSRAISFPPSQLERYIQYKRGKMIINEKGRGAMTLVLARGSRGPANCFRRLLHASARPVELVRNGNRAPRLVWSGPVWSDSIFKIEGGCPVPLLGLVHASGPGQVKKYHRQESRTRKKIYTFQDIIAMFPLSPFNFSSDRHGNGK